MTILLPSLMYLGAVLVTPAQPPAVVPSMSSATPAATSGACWSERDIRAFNDYRGFSTAVDGALDVGSLRVAHLSGCTYRVTVRFTKPAGQVNDFVARYTRGALPDYLMLFSAVDEVHEACAGWILPASAAGLACDTNAEVTPPIGVTEAPSSAPQRRSVGLRSRELKFAFVMVLAVLAMVAGSIPVRLRAVGAGVGAVVLLAVASHNEHAEPKAAPGQGAFRLRDYQGIAGGTMNADLDVTGDSLVVVLRAESYTRVLDGVRVYSRGYTARCAGSRSHDGAAIVVHTRCTDGRAAQDAEWTWRFDAATDTWTRDAFRTMRPGWRPQVFERLRPYDALTG